MYMLEEISSSGFDIELWSLQFLRTIWNKLPDEIDSDNYRHVDTFADLKRLLAAENACQTIIFTSVADNFLNRKIYSFLQENHFLYVFMFPYGNKMGKESLSLKEKLKLALSSNIIKKIIPELQKIYNNKIFKPFHHIDFEKHIISSVKPRAVAINSNDYETYLALESNNERLISEPFILFIDVYFPLHPDIPYFYGVRNVDSKPYLDSINCFFSQLENKYHRPVVIALHPKSNYTDSDYGGRHTYKYKTNYLIKDADMVLTHGGASTSLAVLYNKPTMFIYPQYMLHITPKFVQKLFWFAESLGKQAVNIDALDEGSMDISAFDEESRNKFKYAFMTTKENEHKSNKEIIISLLDDLFNKLENGEKTPFQA